MVKRNGQNTAFKADCHQTQGRRSNMEDAHLVTTDNQGRWLVLVADGLGGHAHGEFASQTVIEVFANTFAQVSEFSSIADYLKKSIYVAATILMQKAMEDPEYAEAATTLSGFVIDLDLSIYTVNVGDSRVYLYRDGQLRRLTRDHSPVQRMLEQGLITEEQALFHPQKNLIEHVISSRLTDLYIDVESHGKIQKNDLLLASTDGFHDVFLDRQIEQLITQAFDRDDLAKFLVDKAYEAGSTDNITVCILRY